MQAWVSVMSWYVAKRRHFEEEIRKYSDPPSDALLPELPPHARSDMWRALHRHSEAASAAGDRPCKQHGDLGHYHRRVHH
jgi:hypothetical protein